MAAFDSSIMDLTEKFDDLSLNREQMHYRRNQQLVEDLIRENKVLTRQNQELKGAVDSLIEENSRLYNKNAQYMKQGVQLRCLKGSMYPRQEMKRTVPFQSLQQRQQQMDNLKQYKFAMKEKKILRFNGNVPVEKQEQQPMDVDDVVMDIDNDAMDIDEPRQDWEQLNTYQLEEDIQSYLN